MDAVPREDLFAVLGLSWGASERAAERARRRLSKRWHPDAPGGNTARMAAINQAADWLTDPARRARYLSAHPAPLAPAATRPGPRVVPHPQGGWEIRVPVEPKPKRKEIESYGPNDALVREFLVRIEGMDEAILARAGAYRRAKGPVKDLDDRARILGLMPEMYEAFEQARYRAAMREIVGGFRVPGAESAMCEIASGLVLRHGLGRRQRAGLDALWTATFAASDSPFSSGPTWRDRWRQRD